MSSSLEEGGWGATGGLGGRGGPKKKRNHRNIKKIKNKNFVELEYAKKKKNVIDPII